MTDAPCMCHPHLILSSVKVLFLRFPPLSGSGLIFVSRTTYKSRMEVVGILPDPVPGVQDSYFSLRKNDRRGKKLKLSVNRILLACFLPETKGFIEFSAKIMSNSCDGDLPVCTVCASRGDRRQMTTGRLGWWRRGRRRQEARR